ncbi:MAG TPA: MFS transporter [Acidimicrobiales bacterium]|nr:MFS transporter [Acidimicrobiales bacterium]
MSESVAHAPIPGALSPNDALEYSSARGRWVLAATILGSGIVTLDGSVVGIALAPISRSFHSGIVTLQWVVTGYTLTLAAFLLLGGSLGDRLGRKRLFSVGTGWFALASVACGLAPTANALIVARVFQGIGGAMLVPASLAILQASFREEDRSKAIGFWSGFSGVSAAAGPLVGGYLIALHSWRLVFFINAPLAAILLAVTARHVPESSDSSASGGIDYPGTGLAVVFLAGLTYGLIEGPSVGWGQPLVLVALIVAAISGPGFIVAERRSPSPLLPLALFRVRQFSAANGVTFLVYGALGGAIFLLPVELQLVDGYSPLSSGLAILPVTVIMFVFSARSGALSARIGPRLQMSLGPVVVGGGLVMLQLATHGSSYLTDVLPAVLVFGTGLALTVAPLTTTALGAVASRHAGVASAVNNVVARAAGLLAVAVLPVLAGITGGNALAPHRFAQGFRAAVLYAGVACAVGGVVAWFTITNPPRQRRGSSPPP